MQEQCHDNYIEFDWESFGCHNNDSSTSVGFQINQDLTLAGSDEEYIYNLQWSLGLKKMLEKVLEIIDG